MARLTAGAECTFKSTNVLFQILVLRLDNLEFAAGVGSIGVVLIWTGEARVGTSDIGCRGACCGVEGDGLRD